MNTWLFRIVKQPALISELVPLTSRIFRIIIVVENKVPGDLPEALAS